MASQRKSAGSGSKKAAKKPAAAARPKTAAKPKSKAPAAKARPAAKVKAAPVVKPSAPKKIVPPVKASKAPVPPAVSAKAAKKTGKSPVKNDGKAAPVLVTRPAPGARPNIRVVERTPTANVRPIGALPPEAVARATHRSPVVPVVRTSAPARPVRETKMDPGAQGVTDKDFQEFEQRLIAERQKIMKEMGYLENTVLKVNQRDSSGDLSGYSFHMADVGTDSMEREKAFLFASSEGRLLMEIDEALRKVYAGEYGRCETCEKPIARARLEAMPYARLCVSCKEKQERENRGGGNAQNP
jgi:RNA polymerase-binding transcription factor DksA